MATHISPVVLRQEVGRRIRLARQHTGLTVVEAAARLEITRSALSRFENGIGRVNVHLLKSMMDVYDQRMDDVLDMIRQARAPGWWKQYGISDKDFIALETAATRISVYEVTLVPGLLQTAEYARAVFTSGSRQRTEDWIANQLEVRLTRQERLTDEEHPLVLEAVVHEFALRNPVGRPAVMRAQLGHLALINELPTVTLRVLPASAFSSEAAYGGFNVLDFPQPGHPSMCHAMHALGDERQDKSEFVEPARLRFARLRAMALDPDESVALIDRVADELWSS
ncbi:helix-turn-helix domain-containing protein [Actinophytocola algeriensis]|uniref:Transcriptional regulator with XRE-family HTH domain n=1 Tax=Actinophytocola algeriensis TaxID=1768010 RepID=A0A7W7PZU2_9PSEU|nr:helix-turn-helix transcriptional regulator [Actinophytocola algeriensis]MBB4904248.1 transcriptional regulator with XRE-family HTH domain [Actinophytocola algeriensis]MBE1476894.1 transcriptional regulator with XRE-family HTH domain [Actinophytocola algeriensis]